LKRRIFLRTAGATTAATLVARHPFAAKLAGADVGALDSSGLRISRDGRGAPIGLLVNGVSGPMAIERDATRFTWRSAAGGRGEMQAAYQVLVSANREHLVAGKADWWDSGKVNSGQSASVEYAGKTLPPATRCWWKVRVWDQTGKSGPYSAPAFFDTGLNRNEWIAQYIWDETKNENNFAYFRKTFSVAGKPKLAKVYVTAHNDYVLYFNGHLLGRGPARSDPYHHGQYNAYDITQLVNVGANVFAAIGHWQGNWSDSGTNAEPAFKLEARLNFPDGSSSTIWTDASWKVLALTPFIESNAMYFGAAGGANNRAAIRFDSRLEPAGWRTAGFDDALWTAATVVDRSAYRLFAQMAPLEREQAELEPVSITRKNDVWLVDFGRCIDGWPKLTMHANRPGDVVHVQYFQMSGERKPAGWDEYICDGGNETWNADCGRHTSFQVLRITGYAGRLRASDVRGMSAYCDAEIAGRFRCSSPLLNAIYKMCVRSAQQNVQQGIISVDANREQSPWLADSWIVGNVLLYNNRDTMMMDKIVRDYAAEQMTDGNFYACSPAPKFQIAEWSMYWPMLLWQQYLFSGDTMLLREMAPHLTQFLNWIKTYQDPTTKLLNPPGWRISDYAGGDLPSGGYNVATACQYFDNLRIASRIFSVLRQMDQSNDYAQQAEAVKAGVNTNLFNGHYYLARIDRKEMFPLASAWPLRFDIEQEEDQSAILDGIVKAGKPDIGGYGGDAFYSGLLNAGGGAFVVEDLTRYRPMLEENKACWETFALGDGEVNHAWTSYPGYLFLKYILGIQPTSGGFATFDVRPETGGLTFAEGAAPTVKGTIRSSWEKDRQGRFMLSVDVPANTRASVYIPKLTGDFTIMESGRQLWPVESAVEVPGLLAVQPEDSAIRCVVGSGAYRFTETPANS
jgi:alpha-L-rhamnosidase